MLRFLVILFLCIACHPAQIADEIPAVYTSADSTLVMQKINQFSANSDLPIIDIAQSFIGTPYKTHTLEIGQKEQVIVNVLAFDCTTYIETCMALKKTSQQINPSFSNYVANLKSIRYRNGELLDYSSRLHYFTEWILDQEKKGLSKNITEELGGIQRDLQLNFMSEHVAAYPQLSKDSNLVASIKQVENEIGGAYFYIPQDKIAEIEDQLKDGMIVGFTTDINGLDFVHTGFVIRKNGKAHLLHASSDFKEVIVSSLPISEYITQNKFQTGIVVLRTQ